jgi:hypothetical protein
MKKSSLFYKTLNVRTYARARVCVGETESIDFDGPGIFLRSWPRNSPTFIEHEVLLPCATGSCSDPNESNSLHQNHQIVFI